MTRVLAGVLSGALAGVTLAANQAGTRSSQRPVFRVATEAVLVPVAVTRDRNPVPGLEAADFEVFDNGVRQTIDSVETGTLPIDVTVVLGAVPDTELDRLYASRLDADTMRTYLQPNDRLRIIAAGAVPRDVVPLQPADTAPALPGVSRTRGSSPHDTLFYALVRPVDAGRRHLIVMFTRADDNWSTLDAGRLPELADRADAVIHVVFFDGIPDLQASAGLQPREPQGARPGGGGEPPASSFMPPRLGENRRTEPRNNMMPAAPNVERIVRVRKTYQALQATAGRTGGRTHLLRDQAAAFREIIGDFRSSYLLRYTPKGVEPGGWHELDVRVTRPGSFDVRARRGYAGG